jgi:DNA-directed RNA polymerase specialized sigma24 family protein
VSKHLGISIGTAKSRIRYAYQRLRENLGSNPTLMNEC